MTILSPGVDGALIPSATDIATCMYDTGIDPFTKTEVSIARGMRDRKMQLALMQFTAKIRSGNRETGKVDPPAWMFKRRDAA